MPYLFAVLATIALFIALILDDGVEKGKYKREKVRWTIIGFSILCIIFIMSVMYLLV